MGVFEVDDINDLCKMQYLFSDVLVIFPGGTGTISELTAHLEQIWDYENVARPKIILYNKRISADRCFFDGILEQFRLSAKCGFNKEDVVLRSIDFIVDNLDELLNVLDESIKRVISQGVGR